MTDKNTSIEGLTRYDHQGCCMAPDATGDYLLISDVRALLASQAEPASLLREALAVFDLMLDGCTLQEFGEYQNGDGETIGPRMDALHAKLRAAVASPSQPHQAVVAAEPKQPMIGRLLDELSALPFLWGFNEPGALVRHSDVFNMLVAVGKEYAATPAAPVDQAPVLADPVLATWPTRIWLQWNTDEREEYPGASEDLTWCSSNVHPSDVEYLRADLAAAPATGARDQAPAHGATYEAIQRACGELPECYEVAIELERGSGCVTWIDDEGERHLVDGEGYISQDINEAVDRAIEHADQRTTPAGAGNGGSEIGGGQ